MGIRAEQVRITKQIPVPEYKLNNILKLARQPSVVKMNVLESGQMGKHQDLSNFDKV